MTWEKSGNGLSFRVMELLFGLAGGSMLGVGVSGSVAGGIIGCLVPVPVVVLAA